MNSAGGNHPWEKIPLNQDEFGRRKSSRGENSVKTGCIRSAGIIPARKWCQIRMNSVGGNHPCEKVLSNQDAFGRRKSSLRENSIKSGWIPTEEKPGTAGMQRKHRQSGTAGIRWHFNFCRIIIVSIYYAAFLLNFRGFECGRSPYPHRMVPDSTFLY